MEEINSIKLQHNASMNEKFNFKVGDLVNVKLQKTKDKLEKARIQKWSDGTYKIINKEGYRFVLIP